MAETVKRGVKRKRETHRKLEDIPSKLRAKLHHGLKEVKKTSKKVKTFETQKVVKKLKDARKSEDESNIKNLESQLECLKHIDPEGIAFRSLRSRINKDAFLSKNVDCHAAVSAELSLPLNNLANDLPARALVESRLLSSKVISLEITNVIQSLKLVLGAGGQEMPMTDRYNNMDGVEEGEEEEKGAIANAEAPPPKQKALTKEIGSEAEGEEEEKEGEESNDDAAWTGFNDEILDESEQSDEADGRESGTVHSQDLDALSSTSDDSELVSPRQASIMEKALSIGTVPKGKKGKAGESTFLPSLSVGFINGDSDSEWSDAEVDLADAPERKNRRGQRARKAIWEKKYGKNANHIKKQHENDVSAAVQTAYGQRGGRGRGAPRGGIVRGRGRPISEETHVPSSHTKAPPAGRGRGRGYDERTVRGDLDVKATSNVRPRDHGLGDDSRPLHPSWEAKRRLKEKQSPAILPSMGTKMTFT